MAGAHKNPRQKKASNGRFQSILTQALVDQLCETHETGRDFRNVTAVRCGVHPTLITQWLKRGALGADDGLYSELFMRFARIEGDIRAVYIAEVSDPTAQTEQTEYEDGKPVSKTVTARRTQGIQWLMERRFRQFRVEHVQKADETEAVSFLEPQATVYTADMVLGLVQQMAANPERLPEAVRLLFANTDWRVPREIVTDGQTSTH